MQLEMVFDRREEVDTIEEDGRKAVVMDGSNKRNNEIQTKFDVRRMLPCLCLFESRNCCCCPFSRLGGDDILTVAI